MTRNSSAASSSNACSSKLGHGRNPSEPQACCKAFHATRWLGDQPTYTFSPVPHDSVRLAIKRMIDVVGAGIGVIVLAPVFLACALAVKLTSRGPVFFAQVRCGRRGVPFTFSGAQRIFDASQTTLA